MASRHQLLKHESPVRPVLCSQVGKPVIPTIKQVNHNGLVLMTQQSNQDLSLSQIIRTFGKQFRQVRKQYTDGLEGRCVMGVIMSYYGWDGECISNAERKLYAALRALRQAGISKELLIELNDSGATFDEIADYLDNIQNR